MKRCSNAIRDQLQVALDYEKLLLAMQGGSSEASVQEKHKAAVASVKLRLNALKKKRAGLYESYVEGIPERGGIRLCQTDL